MSEHANASVRAARQAAEAVRALNHAAARGDGWAWPCEVYDTIGALEHLARMLPQAFNQMTRWLDAEQYAERIGHDRRGESAGLTVALTMGLLGDAQYHAGRLREVLAEAQQEAAHLTGVRPEESITTAGAAGAGDPR